MKHPHIVRLALHGCANRPFYHIVVARPYEDRDAPGVEQVGTYDPMPNRYNEKLVSFDFQRIRHWMSKGAKISEPVEILLGLSGFLPIHPRTYLEARRNQKDTDNANSIETSPNEPNKQ